MGFKQPKRLQRPEVSITYILTELILNEGLKVHNTEYVMTTYSKYNYNKAEHYKVNFQ